jgi:RecA/RadA recombinase
MSVNKIMQQLLKQDGAVTQRKDRFSKILKSSSPSVDFTYGRGHGLPQGYTAVLYGPPKGGKSILSHMMMGAVHQADPEAIVIKYDTEFRADGQLTPSDLPIFGIDDERMVVVEGNSPVQVFDQIEKNVGAVCEANPDKVKLIVVDSISGVQGRREMGLESVEKMTVGDHAQTIQIGLKRILPVIRKYDIGLVLICQVRGELDQTEIMRGNKTKMAASWGLQHMSEYFIAVEVNKTKDGRTSLQGDALVNEDMTDLAGRAEETGIKVRCRMKENSMGPKGRTAEFTFDFHKGLVNTYEEVFKLGIGRNIVNRPNQLNYEFGGQTWKGKDSFINALKESPQLQADILAELQRRDQAGEFVHMDKVEAADLDAETA